jgi:hypothetical protein
MDHFESPWALTYIDKAGSVWHNLNKLASQLDIGFSFS